MRFLLTLLTICLLYGCTSKNDSIKVKGSDTEVNLVVEIAEAFYKNNKESVVSVSGGGSGLGIASLLNGNADLANSSRRIKKSELGLFESKGIAIDSFIFAQDAVAFIVSEHLGVDSLLVDQLGEILNGNISNWSKICGQDIPITVYGRQSNSGTYVYLMDYLNIQFSPKSLQMNGNAQIMESIKVDKSGIGYVGVGYLKGHNLNGLKVLKIGTQRNRPSVSPLEFQKIASGMYAFQRPLYQYYRRESWNKIQPFIEFEKSDKGQEIIISSGYYPPSQLKNERE